MLVAAILYFVVQDFSTWWFLALLIAPDVSMLGYLTGSVVGAGAYNFFHSKAFGVALIIIGYFFSVAYLIPIGVVIVGHSSFDRVLGYGLKYSNGFKFTHLGEIGNKKD